MGNQNLWSSREADWTLWNPTNEEFDLKYAGRSFTLEAGGKIDHVNEACKNHLINSFGPRGLVALGYSDHGHEEEIGKSAVETNKAFKARQIRIYNESNEARKLKGLGCQMPPKKVKEYAVELGMQLLEPYNLKDEEKSAIAKSTVENEKLKLKLEEQEKEMAELREMMKNFMSPESKPRLTGAQRTLRGEG